MVVGQQNLLHLPKPFRRRVKPEISSTQKFNRLFLILLILGLWPFAELKTVIGGHGRVLIFIRVHLGWNVASKSFSVYLGI